MTVNLDCQLERLVKHTECVSVGHGGMFLGTVSGFCPFVSGFLPALLPDYQEASSFAPLGPSAMMFLP